MRNISRLSLAFGLAAGLNLSPATLPAAADIAPQPMIAESSDTSAITQQLGILTLAVDRRMADERRASKAADRARHRADEARRKAELLAAQAQDQTRQNEKARKQAELAAVQARDEAKTLSAEADKLQALAREQKQEVDHLQATMAELQEQLRIEIRNRWILAGASAALVAAILIAAWLILRRNRLRSRSAIEAVIASNPPAVADCVLIGADATVHLAGRQLPKAAGGVVVGRNPEKAHATLAPADVSREHARFFHDGNGYRVEDMQSSFGTTLNGSELEPYKPTPVRAGDQVAFAGHQFEFRVLNAAGRV